MPTNHISLHCFKDVHSCIVSYAYLFLQCICVACSLVLISHLQYVDEIPLRLTWTVGCSVCQVFPLETPSFPGRDQCAGLEIQGREFNEESKCGAVMSQLAYGSPEGPQRVLIRKLEGSLI